MPKKKTDKTYALKSQSKVITEFQKIVNNTDSSFSWSVMLNKEEMRFVYDMLSRNEVDSNFFPTEKQSKWGMVILNKLKNSKKEWKTKNKDNKTTTKVGKTKKYSTRKNMVARRKAREYLKMGGTIPKDIELARLLYEKKQIKTKPNKSTAIKLLIEWNET